MPKDFDESVSCVNEVKRSVWFDNIMSYNKGQVKKQGDQMFTESLIICDLNEDFSDSSSEGIMFNYVGARLPAKLAKSSNEPKKQTDDILKRQLPKIEHDKNMPSIVILKKIQTNLCTSQALI